MKKSFYSAVVVFVFLSFVSFLYAKDYIAPEQAGNYIGEVKTVCGVVASAKYASHSRGQPTFLNLDRPYPNHIFTVVIWGEDRHKFSHPPRELLRWKENLCEGADWLIQGSATDRGKRTFADQSEIVFQVFGQDGKSIAKHFKGG